MSTRINTIEADQFPADVTLQGYLWYSDQRKPEIIAGPLDLKSKLTGLPFVVEGMLYDDQSKISYRVLHLNGKNTIQKIDLSDLSGVEHDEQIYFTRRVNSYERYRMIEAWKEQSSLQGLPEFKSLIPSWSAFKGFVK